MSRSRLPRFMVLVCLLLAVSLVSPPFSAAQTPTQIQPSPLSALPLVFEKNQGQAPSEYQFLTHRDGIQTYYFADGIDVFVPQSKTTQARLQLRWSGADPYVSIDGESQLPGRSNYFRGNDASRWLRGIPQFAQVRYQHLYPGIDALFHGTREFLEHDFIVQPGADPAQIAFRANYPAHITASGDLEFDLNGSTIHLRQPIAYQEIAAVRKDVSVKYVLGKDGDVRFALGQYDPGQTLVIDPIFVFSTYLTGGAGADQITAVTTDASGNVYVTGFTAATDFPVTNAANPLCLPCTDVAETTEGFFSKLDPTGHTLLYSTLLGGTHASGGFGTYPWSIALDANGNVLISGVSSSDDFPLTGSVVSANTQNFNANYYFVASLKPDGSAFNYSGLIGGQEGFYTNGQHGRMTVDANGNLYLAGTTSTPTSNSQPERWIRFLLTMPTTGCLS